jgi:hypothetical protein
MDGGNALLYAGRQQNSIFGWLELRSAGTSAGTGG